MGKSASACVDFGGRRMISKNSYIHITDPKIVEAGVVAFKKEIVCQLQYTLDFLQPIFKLGLPSRKFSYSDLERYHAEIFEYYTTLRTDDLDQSTLNKLDKLLRVSRSLMNSAKYLFEAKDELLVLESEADEIHQKAYRKIKARISALITTGRKVDIDTLDSSEIEIKSAIEELHEMVEAEDKEYIWMCSAAVSRPDFKKTEVTFLLMLNRVITQSCRMMVFGMRTLSEPEEK